jgi:hypothetical protein
VDVCRYGRVPLPHDRWGQPLGARRPDHRIGVLAIQPDLIEDGRVFVYLTWLTLAAYMSIGIALIAFGLIFFDIFVRGHYSRWPLYASVAVLGCGSLVCFFAGSAEWTEQYTEGVASVYAASVHARFAIELCAIGALDLLASIVLLVRRWGWGWWLVIGMQVGVFVLAQIEAQLIDPNSPGWSVFSRIPLLTLFMLFAVRLAAKTGLMNRLTASLTASPGDSVRHRETR